MRGAKLPNQLLRVCFAMRREHGNEARDIMRRQVASLTGLLMAVCLTGCASTAGRYPSLALRDFETRPQEASAAGAIAPQPLPPPVDPARIAAIRSAAQTAFGGFTRQQDDTAAMVSRARGQSIETDARSRALAALAELSSLRSATFVQLGDLDLLAANTAIEFGVTEDIDAARREVLAMVDQQDKVLGTLWLEMGQ
jgi:hypothetical protein